VRTSRTWKSKLNWRLQHIRLLRISTGCAIPNRHLSAVEFLICQTQHWIYDVKWISSWLLRIFFRLCEPKSPCISRWFFFLKRQTQSEDYCVRWLKSWLLWSFTGCATPVRSLSVVWYPNVRTTAGAPPKTPLVRCCVYIYMYTYVYICIYSTYVYMYIYIYMYIPLWMRLPKRR